jgi:uncharacterized protein YjiS (DUF1127 family)
LEQHAMSTMGVSDAKVRAYRAARRRRRLQAIIVRWWQRLRSRYELMSLSESELRDVGLSRGDAEFESSKPFWQS